MRQDVTVLADLGGTNLRFARAGDPERIATYKIADYPNFESALYDFAPDVTDLYLASALAPLDGIIEDKRFTAEGHWRIDLSALKLKTCTVLNDLEAATYGLSSLPASHLEPLLSPVQPQRHFNAPPKLLIGVGTGIGHAFLYEKPGTPPFVQNTHGGHVPAFGINDEHREIIDMLTAHNKLPRDLIVENIIGGRGLWTLIDLIGRERAVRLFWEFLGLYCHMLVGTAGAYGGIYLTGGVIDDMIADKTVDTDSFRKFFVRPMVDVVVESLSSMPVFIIREANLPILGLSVYRGARA